MSNKREERTCVVLLPTIILASSATFLRARTETETKTNKTERLEKTRQVKTRLNEDFDPKFSFLERKDKDWFGIFFSCSKYFLLYPLYVSATTIHTFYNLGREVYKVESGTNVRKGEK